MKLSDFAEQSLQIFYRDTEALNILVFWTSTYDNHIPSVYARAISRASRYFFVVVRHRHNAKEPRERKRINTTRDVRRRGLKPRDSDRATTTSHSIETVVAVIGIMFATRGKENDEKPVRKPKGSSFRTYAAVFDSDATDCGSPRQGFEIRTLFHMPACTISPGSKGWEKKYK